MSNEGGQNIWSYLLLSILKFSNESKNKGY